LCRWRNGTDLLFGQRVGGPGEDSLFDARVRPKSRRAIYVSEPNDVSSDGTACDAMKLL